MLEKSDITVPEGRQLSNPARPQEMIPQPSFKK
jgi:hypothetical protein